MTFSFLTCFQNQIILFLPAMFYRILTARVCHVLPVTCSIVFYYYLFI